MCSSVASGSQTRQETMTDERLCTWLVLLVIMVLSRQHCKLMHGYNDTTPVVEHTNTHLRTRTFMHIYIFDYILFLDFKMQIFKSGINQSLMCY